MHSDNKMKARGPVPGRHVRVRHAMKANGGETIWLFIVQSRYLWWRVALILLLGLSSAAFIIVECCAESSSIRSMIEDQDSIVVSGSKDQQRDSVLANVIRYHNVLEIMERLTH
jgi:hypothetical protein